MDIDYLDYNRNSTVEFKFRKLNFIAAESKAKYIKTTYKKGRVDFKNRKERRREKEFVKDAKMIDKMKPKVELFGDPNQSPKEENVSLAWSSEHQRTANHIVLNVSEGKGKKLQDDAGDIKRHKKSFATR